MPQYWLKPLGTTQPFNPVYDDWASERGLDDFELTTGPATPKTRPQMGPHDRVLLHAVGESRVFAEGEILGPARYEPHRPGGDRWPYTYPYRIDVWVPLVKEGPRTADFAPKKTLGRMQRGAAYASLTRQEYEEVIHALEAQPMAHRRS